jgi:ankyrin repeat protein
MSIFKGIMMNLIKKIIGISLLASVTIAFAATDLNTLEQSLKSDINGLIKTTETKLQEISLEAIDSFYIPPTNVLNKEISNLPDFLNSKYIDLAGGKYSIGGVSGTKPGIYNNTLRVFNERSERLITESINSFNNLPSIREISKDVDNQEVVSQAREDFLSMLLAIKNNIYLNIVDAKDYILQDIRSYINNLIADYTAEKAKQLGAPVVYSEPMVQKGFWDNVKTLTTGWWKEFKKEAFTSHIDPETGKCLTAKNPLAKKGEESQFNVTPFSSKETKTTVCRSFLDQLAVTGENITTNITTKLKEGVVEVAGATAEAIGQGVKEVPGKISEAINKPRETEEKPQSSTSADELLLKAAQSTFDKKSIDDIFTKNPNINTQDKNGNTPLILAFDNDNYELAAYLLEQDDINTTIQNKQSETALFALTKSYARQEAKVRHDLSKKANLDEQIDPIVMMLQDSVNIPNNQGKTPLMQAAQNDNSYLVTLLIDNGANATIKDKNGKTAYNYAEGKPLTISALNQSGDVQLPDSNAKDNDGNTALIRAFNNDDYGSAKYLLNQPNIDIIDQNKQGETALFALVKSYAREEAKVRHDLSKKSNLDEQMEQFVIKLKGSIDIPDKQGKTPLMLAAQNDNSYLVILLIENGADINLKDKNGKTAFSYAEGKPFTLDALNQGKFAEQDITKLNINLLAEVMKRDPDINTIKELVDQGADVDLKDAKGNPLILLPLILQPRKENIALELLKLGANPNIGNSSSQFTALMEQARKEYFQQGYSDITLDKALIDKGAHVNAFDNAHKSALLYAAQAYNLPSMKLLLESGADPDAKNTENENALNLVAKWYLNQKETFSKQSRTSVFDKLVSDIVDLLIRYKINVNNQAKDSTTPLMVFAAVGDGKIVEKLLQAGAQLDTKDSRGETALDYAKPGSTAEGILKAYYL